MKINVRIFLFFVLLMGCNCVFSCDNNSFFNIKIGILLNSSSIEIESSRGVYVIDSLNKKIKFNNVININIAHIEKFININEYKFFMPIKIEPIYNIISVNKNKYRGYIELKKSLNNKINVINVLNLDEYTMGVLPKEMSKNNEIEALKAQAIVSRTYAIVNYNKHIFDGFNLCSGVHCQVYGGYSFESNNTNKAVIETNNEILTYNNKFAETFYHANCGGYTEKPKYIWGYDNNKSLKYLNGVKCGYCDNDFHSKWETILDINFIEKKFLINNINIGKIKDIKIKEKTKLGTTKSLEINHSKGKTVLTSYKFRTIVDSNRIKSHNFVIKKKNKSFCLNGKGWGHKVGMCQCGANNMAKRGQNYKNILNYYYPGTKIMHIGDI